MILNAEDDVHELQRRQWAQTTTLEPSDHELQLLDGYILTHKRSSYSLVMRDDQGHVTRTQFYSDLKASLIENKIELLITDPLVDLSSGLDENSAEMQEVRAALRDIARDLNIPVLCVHHIRKSGVGGDQNAGRGSSTLSAGARVVITLEPMSKETAAKMLPAGEQGDHWKYVCLEMAKSNHGPRGAARWFQTISVEMPVSGDHTVAIVAASFDGKVGATQSILEAQWLDDFLNGIEEGRPDGGRFTLNGGGKFRAAQILIDDYDLPKFQANAAIDELIKAGVLALEEYQTPQRKKRQGFVVKFRPERGGSNDLPF